MRENNIWKYKNRKAVYQYKWRIILQPLDEEENIIDPCNIDEIAAIVKIVEIREVSAHYE